ncbi:serine hydrolase [Saccharothrix syringae]|uniref:Serine hydrolase n=1 Tax=Saccharothrix syringae TaxID=103733 RepID=A0A5Q0H5U5_SACSY|nr:serine hydrolase [Saccharothrix syringae]QFZ21519.1 serine hydrolase [Saccharothrix syringae]
MTRRLRIDDLTPSAVPERPALSPDGAHVAYVLRTVDTEADRDVRRLWRVPTRGGAPERLTAGWADTAPAWSPDGGRVAFLRAQDGPAQVWLLPAAGGEPTPLTALPLGAGEPVWSPDGTRIAFTAPVDRHAEPDRDDRARSRRAAAPAVVDRLDHRADGVRAHLHVVDVPTGGCRRITDGDWHAGRPSWSPDGTALAFAAATAPDADLTGHVPVHVVAAAGGVPARVGPADLVAGHVAWTADGTALLVVAAPGPGGPTRLLRVPPAGGPPADLVAGGGAGAPPVLVDDGRAVLFRDRGRLCSVPVDGGTPRPVPTAGLVVSDPAVAGGRVVVVRRTPTSRGELVCLDPATGAEAVLTDHGAPVPFPEEEREFTASDGTAVHGRLVRDPSFPGPRPVLLDLHDGPHDAEALHRELAARGWVVLLLDADARHPLEPLDRLIAEGLVDPARQAVAGHGSTAHRLTGQGDRFAAAVVDGLRPGRAPGGPLRERDHGRTPTLFLHGAEDAHVTRQWHAALRARGVPTRLVLYPGGAGFPPSHRLDHHRRLVDWVERHAAPTAAPRPDPDHWRRRLAALARLHDVPGAVLGVLRVRPGGEDDLVEVAHGVLNLATGVPTTTDSLFQIGSITKVWTAALVLRLVDEGLLDLDAPVVDVLPELRLADPEVTKRVTARHLLTHTSGIDGDVFTDTGRGDDCVAEYVARLGEVAQNHPPGATWSYCNSGFVLAGRVVEQLTGGTWDAALRELLITPLGLRATGTLPEEALLHRAAVGHTGTRPEPVPVWGLPRSVGPAGLIHSTAAEVLAFARLHLTGGLAPDGTRVLGESAVAAMAARQAELPAGHLPGESMGLGWFRTDWHGRALVCHDGNTPGQSAYLRVLPDAGLAVVLLTNSDGSQPLAEQLLGEVFAELAGVTPPPGPRPPDEPVTADARPHLGTYERAGQRIEVLVGEAGPRLRTTATGPLAELEDDPVQEYDLVAVGRDRYVVWEPRWRAWVPVTFHRLPTGERYVHVGVRATPKVG